MAKSKKANRAEIEETLQADKYASEDTQRLNEEHERKERELFVEKKKAILAILKEIQHQFAYDPKELSEDKVAEISIKKMSRYARAFKNFKGAAGTAIQVSGAVVQVGERIDKIHYTPQNEGIANGFHIGALALTIINFFRIPAMYLFGRLMGQPVPLTLNDKGRALYSAVLLALTIVAITVPVAAPFIAFIMAGFGFIESTYFLGKLAYERYKLTKQEKSLNQEIQTAEDKFDAMQREAVELEQAFAKNDQDPTILSRIDKLKQNYDDHVLHMQALYDERAQNEQLITTFSQSNVFFRTISVILATAAIAGLIVALFFPPIGLGILTGIAITGSAIALGKLAFSAAQWVKNKWNASPSPEPSVNLDGQDLQAEATLDNNLTKESSGSLLDSTAKALSTFNIAGRTYASVAAEANEPVARQNEPVVHQGESAQYEEQTAASSPRFFPIIPPSSPNLEGQPEAATSPEAGGKQLVQ